MITRIRIFGYSVVILTILLIITGCRSEKQESPINDNIEATYYTTWQHYLGDPGRSHFSVLDQIDTSNVDQLKAIWTYNSGGLSADRRTQMQTNPLVLEAKLFGVSAATTLFCLNAETGELLWEFEPPSIDATGLGNNRGLNFWPSNGIENERLFFASGPRLYAVDPENGQMITSFGDEGSIDLRAGLGRDPETLWAVANTPGAIFKDLLILGTRVYESPGAAPGHIRAYDVLTGEIKWTFHTIPQPGEYGFETWPAEAYLNVGGANSWSGVTLDEEREMVFIPTGSAAFDYYGGDRIGKNLFANSLIALNANSGERIWHYQFVRHDLWDRDLPAPPNLLNLNIRGKTIPAVAQITKSGHVFVFHRETGEPLFPIEEKVYPASKIDGEEVYRVQPLPLLPKPFARQILTENDLYAPNRPAFVDDFVDNTQNIEPPTVLEKFRAVTSKGQFIPIDTRGVIIFPGLDGGAEWGGAAVDPRTGILYVNSNEMAWILRLRKITGEDGEKLSKGANLAGIHCSRCHGGELQGLGDTPGLKDIRVRQSVPALRSVIKNGKGSMPSLPHLSDGQVNSIVDYLTGREETGTAANDEYDLPYAIAGLGRFKDDRGFPVMKPPWGLLSAIDLNSGEYLWQVPLGDEEKLEDPDYPVTGTENYGGPVITAGGLLFIGATNDEKFRAFSIGTGRLLWETYLPAGGYATPATYQVNGKQYVVIACGGGKMGTKSGDAYVAFALP